MANPKDNLAKYERLEKAFEELGIDGRIHLMLMFYTESKYKHINSTEQEEIIEYVLHSHKYPRLNEDKHGRRYDFVEETFDIMLEEQLIIASEDFMKPSYIPTAKGYRINERGGWLAYVKKGKEDEEKAEADRILAREVNKSVKWTNKNQVRILWFTLAVSLFTLYIQWNTNKQLGKENSPQEMGKELIVPAASTTSTKELPMRDSSLSPRLPVQK